MWIDRDRYREVAAGGQRPMCEKSMPNISREADRIGNYLSVPTARKSIPSLGGNNSLVRKTVNVTSPAAGVSAGDRDAETSAAQLPADSVSGARNARN